MRLKKRWFSLKTRLGLTDAGKFSPGSPEITGQRAVEAGAALTLLSGSWDTYTHTHNVLGGGLDLWPFSSAMLSREVKFCALSYTGHNNSVILINLEVCN